MFGANSIPREQSSNEDVTILTESSLSVEHITRIAQAGKRCHESCVSDEGSPKQTRKKYKNLSLPSGQDPPTTVEEKPWDEARHRDFVSAIFDLGAAHSSPSVILEKMRYHPDEMTSDRIKSHLQKFRKDQKKEKERFMEDYDSFFRFTKFLDNHPKSYSTIVPGLENIGGTAAGLVSYSVMKEDQKTQSDENKPSSPHPAQKEAVIQTVSKSGRPAAKIAFPTLSGKERRSPLGMSLTLVKGLLEQMEKYLVQSSEQEEASLTRNQSSIYCEQSSGRIQEPNYQEYDTFDHFSSDANSVKTFLLPPSIKRSFSEVDTLGENESNDAIEDFGAFIPVDGSSLDSARFYKAV